MKVACKLPNGLTIKHKDVTVTLNGATHSSAVGGFGVTLDVDADWFKSWQEEAKDFPAVSNGSIFAFDRDTAAVRERRNDPTVRTGLEPLNPDAPAPGVEPTDAMKRELAKVDADPEA